MKSKILASVVSIALLWGAASCSVMNKNNRPAQPKTEKSEKGKKKNSATLPQDRVNIVQPTENVYTPEELAKGIVKGDWAIEAVFGQTAVGETPPYLKFVPHLKKVFGNNGCNTINADYLYNPTDSTLSFSNVAATKLACDKEGITDELVMQALKDARYYTWFLHDDEYHLHFFDENRQPVLDLMHQNFQFLNGTWRVTAIGTERVNNPDMKLVIDVDEGKIHGNTGCNVLNGTLETDMDAANSISFQAIGTTKMACPEGNMEMQLLVALEEATRARAVSPTVVEFINDEGRPVLRLERTSDK